MLVWLFRVDALAAALLLAVGADGVSGATVRTDTPSGLPVPRFVSVAAAPARCRIGPSLQHPSRYTYRRRGLPVMVVAETRDHWRKIRDRDGDECWMFHTLLRDLSHVVATQDVTLTTRPGGRGADVARLSSGVMARLARRRDGWALIEAGALRGWAPAAALWGLGPDVRASADDLN